MVHLMTGFSETNYDCIEGYTCIILCIVSKLNDVILTVSLKLISIYGKTN